MLGIVWNALRLAMSAIVRNPLRALLTVLGILIGISAVVIVTGLADGASSQVTGQIDSFAANAIFVHPQPVQASGARQKATGRLTEADMYAVKHEANSVDGTAPWLSALGQVVYADKNVSTTLIGTNMDYMQVRKWVIDKGEMWTGLDEEAKTKVCVVGHTVADNLFGPGADPIGRVIRIGRSPYRVIGELNLRGNSPFGEDQDDRIMMPIGSFRARVMHTSPGRVDQFMASAKSPEVTENAKRQIDAILRQRHHIEPGADPDFEINTQADMQKATGAITAALSALLLGVATISLLVGGIGVMNIMLVSVAERTREIGIRMSIGARSRDILTQFLIEAVVLSLVGGVLGIIIGMAATAAVGSVLGWSLTPSLRALLIAVATSVGIGVVFGFLPARNAARLDPIDALRTD
jgi:putative ABC transport system permease protein